MTIDWYLTIGIQRYTINNKQALLYKEAMKRGLPAIELSGNIYSTNCQSLVMVADIDFEEKIEDGYSLCEHGNLLKDFGDYGRKVCSDNYWCKIHTKQMSRRIYN